MLIASPDVARAYGVPFRRSIPLRLGMHPEAPNHGTYRRWLEAVEQPLAIDLFSGAGGLTQGLEVAGYRVALAVDINEWALETHAHNFRGLALSLDLGDLTVRDQVVSMFEGVEVGLIAGGPPCQPYSRAGRSKIRSLVASGDREGHDSRRELWAAFVDIVERIGPKAVLLENVPDMALGDGAKVLRQLLTRLEVAGYEADVRLVDTWHYGVPQHRQRLVLVAVRAGVGFAWPEPTDRVTLRDAIGDLPVLDSTGPAVGAPALTYEGPLTEFQRQARKGCDGENEDVVFDHVTRAVRQDDMEAFRLMKAGTLYSELPEGLRRYRSDIFDDKYNRLDWEKLSRSITAHIAKDGYWYIHPDQHRTLTVREAARIQTFPDHFRFAGSRSHQFAQIGNAVPPALAAVMGRAILRTEVVPAVFSGDLSLTQFRKRFRAAMATWAEKDIATAPWAYPADPWQVIVGQIISNRGPGWPNAQDVLQLVPSLAVALPESLAQLAIRSDPGPRRRSVERLAKIADAISTDPNGWEGSTWMMDAGVGPAFRSWFNLLARGEGIVASSGVLRVVARATSSDVDRHNRMSTGRMELAKLVGSGQDAPKINAAMHRVGTTVCTESSPDCSRCPIATLCESRTC